VGALSDGAAAAPLIRSHTCKTCGHREIESDGKPRCHEGPAQRSAFVVPTPEGRLVLQIDTGFPDAHDDWWCSRWKPRVHLSPTSA
jgi:hypothetical protein